MDAAEVKAFQKRKKNFKPSKIEDIAVVAKTKMVTAPGRNPTNKKVRVLDRPVKKPPFPRSPGCGGGVHQLHSFGLGRVLREHDC